MSIFGHVNLGREDFDHLHVLGQVIKFDNSTTLIMILYSTEYLCHPNDSLTIWACLRFQFWCTHTFRSTMFTLSIGTPYFLAKLVLKFEIAHSTTA